LDNVSFNIKKGEIFGLLGPNGAGKTTTLRILSTIYQPTNGIANIMGFDIIKQPGKVRENIGIIPESPGLYDRLTPKETLLYYGRLHGIDDNKIKSRMNSIFIKLEMEEFVNRKNEKLSKGMKQKVVVAGALIHDPPVLLVDEPTSGLDVLSARTVLDFILKSKSEGKTIILSTHIMQIAEELCDRIAILDHGKIISKGKLKNVLKGEKNLESLLLKLLRRKSNES
jgi:sodium transport system ATP-binding protein